jgi:DNA-binding NtrC family response regulator
MSSRGRRDPSTAWPEPAAPLSGATRSILVVDDDPAMLTIAARVLSRDGAAVTMAGSGRDALRMIADGHVAPTVLLTDIDMPAMTGIELAARVAALRPGVRILMMTADPESAEAARRHRDEVGSVLLKPFTADALLAAVRQSADQYEPVSEPEPGQATAPDPGLRLADGTGG